MYNYLSRCPNVPKLGLLGFVLTDDFAESNEAYAYYTYDKDGAPLIESSNLCIPARLGPKLTILLDEIESGPVHHGGRLAISPNGKLFATIGDAAESSLAQDEHSFSGKIISLGDDQAFHILTTGHRNPQGLAWDKNEVFYASGAWAISE